MPKKKSPAVPTTPEEIRKAEIDAILLRFPGVVSKKLNHLDAYFVSDRMFACISGAGLGLRLPVASATELQFSRADVSSFQPAGSSSSREWIQVNHVNTADYEKDLELIQTSIDFVKGGGR
jgi:hypothetical protein